MIILFLLVFLNSLLILFLFEKYSERLGFLDPPGKRKIHSKNVPRNGGFVIYLSTIVCWCLYNPPSLNLIVIPTSIVFFGGALDDYLKSTPPILKLFFQAAGSWIFLQSLDLPLAIKLLLFLFQIGITNSFNLLDNMNGITSLLAMISLAAFSFFTGRIEVNYLIFFFAASLAFLIRNYPKGHIFLGDQGSQFLGFLISALFIQNFVNHDIIQNLSSLQAAAYTIGMILAVFTVFISDTFWVIYVRVKAGQRIFHGDQNHISHNLRRMGFSVELVPFILALIQMPISFLSLFLWSRYWGPRI